MEGSGQVLADHLAIAKYLETKCVSVRTAGENGRYVPSGFAKRATLMMEYSALLMEAVRGEDVLMASDLRGLEALDANPQPVILPEDCHDPQEASEESRVSSSNIGQRKATRSVVAISF